MYLEITALADDVKDAGMLFNGQAFEFGLNIIKDSIINTGKAFAWPMYVARFAPPWGPIGLGLAFWLFPRTLKKPIANWLFDGEVPQPESKDKAAKKDA